MGIDLRNFALFMRDPYESYCPCRERVAAREAAEAAAARAAEKKWVCYCALFLGGGLFCGRVVCERLRHAVVVVRRRRWWTYDCVLLIIYFHQPLPTSTPPFKQQPEIYSDRPLSTYTHTHTQHTQLAPLDRQVGAGAGRENVRQGVRVRGGHGGGLCRRAALPCAGRV